MLSFLFFSRAFFKQNCNTIIGDTVGSQNKEYLLFLAIYDNLLNIVGFKDAD